MNPPPGTNEYAGLVFFGISRGCLLQFCCRCLKKYKRDGYTVFHGDNGIASILELGPNHYQVVIRRKNHPTQTKTFETKREAKAWANVIESEIVRGVFTHLTEAEQTTLGEALERYKHEITINKQSPRAEEKRIVVWLRPLLAMQSLASLRGSELVLMYGAATCI